MNKIKIKKIHLAYGISTTKCGKQLEKVRTTIDINLVDCKNCLTKKS